LKYVERRRGRMLQRLETRLKKIERRRKTKKEKERGEVMRRTPDQHP